MGAGAAGDASVIDILHGSRIRGVRRHILEEMSGRGSQRRGNSRAGNHSRSQQQGRDVAGQHKTMILHRSESLLKFVVRL